MATQSYAGFAREQMARMPLGEGCCMLCELGAFIKTAGILSLKNGQPQCIFHVRDIAIAKRVLLLLKSSLGIVPTVHFINYKRLGGQRVCALSVNNEDSHKLLTVLRILFKTKDGAYSFKRWMPRRMLTRVCCKRSFLRGIFLGGGYLADPKKAYHLDICVSDMFFARMIVSLLAKYGIRAKIIDRHSLHIVYIKHSQSIADFLTLTGAYDAVIHMEGIRVIKAVREKVNRAMNCDQANMNKQLRTSEEQLSAIHNIAASVGLEVLPGKLYEIAQLRIHEPDATLKQLGDMLTPALSKSGVYHRLVQINKISTQLN